MPPADRDSFSLPLSPAVFHILLALAAGEMHGYAIMREVAILSDGQVTVGPGTLYGSIKKLLAARTSRESRSASSFRIRIPSPVIR
jgi:DNA-binding PadR family transcriptional regulator